MFKLIGSCFEYAHLIPQLKTIDEGDILDILELKLELMHVNYGKYKNEKPCCSDDLDKWGTVILLLDKIKEYKNSESKTEDQKIEIIKLIYELL